MIQAYRLSGKLGTISPYKSIAEEIHKVPVKMLTYRPHCAALQEHQRLLHIRFFSFGLKLWTTGRLSTYLRMLFLGLTVMLCMLALGWYYVK